jgi:hypothetical protein
MQLQGTLMIVQSELLWNIGKAKDYLTSMPDKLSIL